MHSDTHRQGLSHIAPTPRESHFPQSHGQRFVSVLASRFSDRSSHVSQMPTPGWPPGILQVKEPEVNPQPTPNLSSASIPSSRKAHHLPNGQSQKPDIIHSAAPLHTSNPIGHAGQGVASATSFKCVCLSPPPGALHLPSHQWLCISSPTAPNRAPGSSWCHLLFPAALRRSSSSPSAGGRKALASFTTLRRPETSPPDILASLGYSHFSNTPCSLSPLGPAQAFRTSARGVLPAPCPSRV